MQFERGGYMQLASVTNAQSEALMMLLREMRLLATEEHKNHEFG
jgi:hypothetical protein